jgi:hypothetical protein
MGRLNLLRLRALLVVPVVAALGFATVDAAATPVVGDSPMSGNGAFAPECLDVRPVEAKARCYSKALLAAVEASGDPSREVPRLDAQTRAAGGFVAAGCHILMHPVGRAYAKRHHVTLATLQRYLPRSGDAGCSAGFGHGLIMALGPQILQAGPKGALATCLGAGSRVRQYTCVHGLGHAYMRLFSDHLKYALPMCRALGPNAAPDCAQGAFHDYWISLSGRDGTTKTAGASSSPRIVCARQPQVFVLPCWYRVFLEQPPSSRVDSPADIRRLCRGLLGVQRSGCVAAAALSGATSDPFQLAFLCRKLSGPDVVSCLRAVPVGEFTGQPTRQVALIQSCAGVARSAQAGCYEWLGQVLAVVTNGHFDESCGKLRYEATRARCTTGTKRLHEALVTFA